jgi:hypothetical protein
MTYEEWSLLYVSQQDVWRHAFYDFLVTGYLS